MIIKVKKMIEMLDSKSGSSRKGIRMGREVQSKGGKRLEDIRITAKLIKTLPL